MNTIESIWKKVERRGPDECWPWVGGWKSDDGYGRMDISSVEGAYSNRIAYLAANPGSIELKKGAREDDYVLHTCDNPACCNPQHLYLGTHQQNMLDKVARGRTPDFRGAKGPRSKLSESDVAEVRHLLSANLSCLEIARVFGVSKPTIQSVRTGRHYG